MISLRVNNNNYISIAAALVFGVITALLLCNNCASQQMPMRQRCHTSTTDSVTHSAKWQLHNRIITDYVAETLEQPQRLVDESTAFDTESTPRRQHLQRISIIISDNHSNTNKQLSRRTATYRPHYTTLASPPITAQSAPANSRY